MSFVAQEDVEFVFMSVCRVLFLTTCQFILKLPGLYKCYCLWLTLLLCRFYTTKIASLESFLQASSHSTSTLPQSSSRASHEGCVHSTAHFHVYAGEHEHCTCITRTPLYLSYRLHTLSSPLSIFIHPLCPVHYLLYLKFPPHILFLLYSLTCYDVGSVKATSFLVP